MKHSDPLIKNIKQTLDQQTLDSDTTRRLKQARALALQPTQAWWRTSYAVPAMALASLVSISLVLNLQLNQETSGITQDSIEVFELLSDRDDIELYENLEFYVWLDQQPVS